MPHDTTSHDEATAIDALLRFGSKASGTAVAPIGSSSADDASLPAIVSVASSNKSSSDASTIVSSSESKKRLAAVAMCPSVTGATTITHGKARVVGRTVVPAVAAAAPAHKRQRTTADDKVRIIQDCHAVLGDRHCAGRTTIATVILREIKLQYKEERKGKGVDSWYDEAMEDYYRRVREKVPGFSEKEYKTVLVYSYAPKGKKEKGHKSSLTANDGSSRIEEPNCYKYHSDVFPKYGTAKVPEAIKFFFNSKDAPTLPKEISKYRSDYERLKADQKQPPPEKMAFFEDFLKFCEDNLQKAKDEEMAQQLLDSLNLIPTLRRLWDTLKAATHRCVPPPFTTSAQAVMQASAPSMTPPPSTTEHASTADDVKAKG